MSGLFYAGVGNDIGVEMAIGEANRLNVAAAVRTVRDQLQQTDDAAGRLGAEQDEQRGAGPHDGADPADAADTLPDAAAQSPDDLKGLLLLLLLLSFSHTHTHTRLTALCPELPG